MSSAVRMAVLATLLAVAAHLWGPPGGDEAAHLHLIDLWRVDRGVPWDNLWYSGRYAFVNYSLVYHPLAAVAHPALVSGLSGGLAAWAFGSLVEARWAWAGRTPGWLFACLVPLQVVAGTYPFALGLALVLCALLAIQHRRAWVGIACATCAWLASPLALAFLLLALAAVWTVRRDVWRSRAGLITTAGAGTLLALQLVLMRAFPTPGARYPFDPKDALAIVLFCVAGYTLTRRLPRARELAAFFALYLATTFVVVLVPTALGGNMVRITLSLGTPLLLVAATATSRRAVARVAAGIAVVGALAWQVTPAVTGAPAAWTVRAPQASYWAPVATFLRHDHDPAFRVHVVATADNWEAYHLPRVGVALTRGWFRQDDFPVNASLYEAPLTAATYLHWLRDVGVRHVFVPDDPLDPTGAVEATLIRGGGVLQPEATLPGWRVYRVPQAEPIVTPSTARVARVEATRMVIRVASPGTYRVRARFSPYLVSDAGACLEPREPWGMTLHAPRAGDVTITFAFSARSAWRAIVGDATHCPGGARP